MKDIPIIEKPELGRQDHPIAYSIKKAAEVVGLSERTIWNLVRSTELPSVRIGTRVLVLHRDIEIFLESRCDRSGSLVRPDISSITTERNISTGRGR